MPVLAQLLLYYFLERSVKCSTFDAIWLEIFFTATSRAQVAAQRLARPERLGTERAGHCAWLRALTLKATAPLSVVGRMLFHLEHLECSR